MTSKDFHNRVVELVHPFFLEIRGSLCNEEGSFYHKVFSEVYSVSSLSSLRVAHTLTYDLWNKVNLVSVVSYVEPGKSLPIHSHLSISNVIYKVTIKNKLRINTGSIYDYLCVSDKHEEYLHSIDALKLELI